MATSQSYIMGHDDRERRRLALQASVLRPITERFFEDAGIGAGMNVQEYDFSLWVPSWPASALNSRVMRVFVELFPKLTHANAGSRLHHWYRQAGFPAPRVSGNVLTDGAPDSRYYEWMVESLRAILPRAEQMGLVQPGEFDLDHIAEQLRAELLATESTAAGIIMMGAYSNKPASAPLEPAA